MEIENHAGILRALAGFAKVPFATKYFQAKGQKNKI